jgi:deoxyribonuclease-4
MIFGAHESISGGVYNAITRGKDATCDAVQIFNKSNSQWRAKKLTSDEIDQYLAAIDETGVTVACSHSSYLINIGSPDEALLTKSRNSLQEETERCNLLQVPNLVFHPGSHVGSGEEPGLDRIAENMNQVLANVSDNTVTLCLETTAGQGSNLGYTFEQIATIMDRVEDKDHLGVCLDTCHIFAAGYAITDPEDYKKTIEQFDDIIGLDNLKIVHTNDSKTEFGSKKDRHEHIGEGHIGIAAFENFVKDERFEDIPFILETPKGDDLAEDVENLKKLRSLVK